MRWAPTITLLLTLAGNIDGQRQATTTERGISISDTELEGLFGTPPPTSDDCTCVQFTDCIGGYFNSDNLGIAETDLNIAMFGYCPDALYICCIDESRMSTTLTMPSPNTDGCGIRNDRGVGFSITGANQGESNFGEFPWMTLLMVKKNDEYELMCGGSLIHHQVVLTAVHCLQDVLASSLTARAGEWDTQSTSEPIAHQERAVTRIIRHEHHTKVNEANDIALVILASPFSSDSHIDVVCLPSQGRNFDNSRCLASGWGRGNLRPRNFFSNILKSIELPIMPFDQCSRAFQASRLGRKFKLHSSFICAGGEPGKDTCKGDGGGPLVCSTSGPRERYMQAGITAWGIGCGGDGLPGAYTSVARFRQWIDNKMIAQGFGTNSYTVPS